MACETIVRASGLSMQRAPQRAKQVRFSILKGGFPHGWGGALQSRVENVRAPDTIRRNIWRDVEDILTRCLDGSKAVAADGSEQNGNEAFYRDMATRKDP